MAEPGLKMELVTRDFNRMLEDLAAIDPRVEFGDVVRSEAGSVVAGAAGRTKAANREKIIARSAAQKFTTLNGKTYYIDRNYRDAGLRQQLVNSRVFARERKLAARGLAKQSWVWIARSLGTPIKAPAYVLAAAYKGQQYPQDGSSTTSGDGSGFTVTITNNLPYNGAIGSQWALLGAMSARARYFERNMAHFAFQSLETRAKKYPGIFSSPVPPAAGFDFTVPEGMAGG
jgi:hypothetical protein